MQIHPGRLNPPPGVQIHPREFSIAVCEGAAAEKTLRALGPEAWALDEASVVIEEMKYDDPRHGSDPSGKLREEEAGASDDLSGGPLDAHRVRQARKEDIV